ncbi:hypothetical protein M501DRAFT_1017696 [Patellaria atrata CBS 101060]|uniref:Uncharacterized protein n=1 Tax=Patellaria atrata CBS 101060 TaxID=1346257 RepID=A0A9P4VRW3_9PEZI|nr:hypothetical protein M501DRAFT_1017696 [Patellaria atrata CBS 101060]
MSYLGGVPGIYTSGPPREKWQKLQNRGQIEVKGGFLGGGLGGQPPWTKDHQLDRQGSLGPEMAQMLEIRPLYPSVPLVDVSTCRVASGESGDTPQNLVDFCPSAQPEQAKEAERGFTVCYSSVTFSVNAFSSSRAFLVPDYGRAVSRPHRAIQGSVDRGASRSHLLRIWGPSRYSYIIIELRPRISDHPNPELISILYCDHQKLREQFDLQVVQGTGYELGLSLVPHLSTTTAKRRKIQILTASPRFLDLPGTSDLTHRVLCTFTKHL